jgi:phenylacetate-CoA ligase
VQNEVLSEMLAYAANFVPYYRDFAWAASLRAGAEVPLEEIPLTPKHNVRSETAAFYGDPVPEEHGAVISKSTSGSTGEPMVIRKTRLHYHHNTLENERLKRDWLLHTMVGRITTTTPSEKHPPGQVEVRRLISNGNVWNIYSYDPRPITELLEKAGAEVLVSRPSTVEAVLEGLQHRSSLKAVCTIGEVVTDSLRQQVQRFPGLIHVDFYGSVETGIMASVCRSCGAYHVADRHLVLELLDDNGNPAADGKLGRVVVTTLFNAAMPLIRYDIGDHALCARRLPCPVSDYGLHEIAGRTLNLFNMPNGSRITPKLNNDDLRALGIRRCKMIQMELHRIDFLYELDVPGLLVPAEHIQRLVDRCISPLIRAIPICVERIHVPSSGKYLLHENRIGVATDQPVTAGAALAQQ